MNICSVIVRARPERLASVRGNLARIAGVEVHGDTADGRVIVTIEDCADGSGADAFVKLHNVDGVIGASLVYQYCDEASEPEPTP
jgi:nitrate reductase NapD